MQRVESVIIHQLHLLVHDDRVEVDGSAVVNSIQQPFPHNCNRGISRHYQPEAASGGCREAVVVYSSAALHKTREQQWKEI